MQWTSSLATQYLTMFQQEMLGVEQIGILEWIGFDINPLIPQLQWDLGSVPAADIVNPQNLNLKTTIGDQVMQEGNTSTMVFSIAELIVSLTKQVTLKPGDVIATGTCALV